MATVQQALPDVKLVIIGEGVQRSKLTALAEDLGVSATFLGQRPIEEVRQWLNRAAVFSVPSVVAAAGDTEGLGMVFLEAQAMELPVVSSLSGGIPEAVIHGETGFLAPERDVQALSHYLLTLLQQPGLRSQFGQAGRQHVCQNFNLKHQTAHLEQLYDRLLETGSFAAASAQG